MIRRDPAFAPGGFVSEGDILLQIQPEDFQNTLDLRESELLQARTELNVEMGRLVGTEAYWVELTVPVTQLRWLEFTHDGQEGALDAQTRLARVLVRVEDPLARDAEPGTPPLSGAIYLRNAYQVPSTIIRLLRTMRNSPMADMWACQARSKAARWPSGTRPRVPPSADFMSLKPTSTQCVSLLDDRPILMEPMVTRRLAGLLAALNLAKEAVIALASSTSSTKSCRKG